VAEEAVDNRAAGASNDYSRGKLAHADGCFAEVLSRIGQRPNEKTGDTAKNDITQEIRKQFN